MSRINRTPEGLQVLLGTQAFGDNPNELSQTVSPTLDMLPFFAATRIRQATLTGSRSTPGEVGRLDLPGKAAILGMAVEIVGGVVGPGLVRYAFTLQRVPGKDPTNPCAIYTTPQLEVDGNITAMDAFMLPNPLIVLPGIKCTLEVLESNGGLFDHRLTVLFYDLEP